MRLFEFVSAQSSTVPDANALMGLTSFLAGRAEDTGAQKQIDQAAFIKLAQDLGITLTRDQLSDLTNLPPLSNLVEPLAPNSNDPIVFKGADQPPKDIKMPVNKAQDIVARAAKSAMKRGMKS